MDNIRKPFQGIKNIIRFNWHFYLIAIGIISLSLFISLYTNTLISTILISIGILITFSVLIATTVSFYVYDISGLYRFDWIEKSDNKLNIININAGFDETSSILKKKYINGIFTTLDFYNPKKHTEVSIKRARKQFPPSSETISIDTSNIKLEKHFADIIFVVFSAHEIRNEQERIHFFKELNRILKPNGKVFITEHLRDFNNLLAYNIGAFHFYSKSSWKNIFKSAHFKLSSEIKNTAFISTFTLEKYGNTF